MKRLWILALVCACCLAAVKSGQTQMAQPVGPVNIGGSVATQAALGPSYRLRCLQVSGTKPAEEVWFLQKLGPYLGAPIEPNEMAFRSLDSPVLRDFASHLPAGARISYLPRMGDDDDPSLQDFAKFCRSKKVDFSLGTSF